MNLQSEKTASPPLSHLLSFENKRVDLNVFLLDFFSWPNSRWRQTWKPFRDFELSYMLIIIHCNLNNHSVTVVSHMHYFWWLFVKPVITFHKVVFFLFIFFTGIQQKIWIIWFRSFRNIHLKLSVKATFYPTYISCYMTHYVLRVALHCILGMDNFKH